MEQQKILIIGSGGREHALGWQLMRFSKARLLFAPGNGGTAGIGRNFPIAPTETDKLVQLALEQKPTLTIVGPEAALALGVVNLFQEKQLPIFGPTKEAAELESNKIFATKFMQRKGIPHPPSFIFRSARDAADFIHSDQYPRTGVVVKYPYLASGKGVIVTDSRIEAIEAVNQIFNGKFGSTEEVLLQEKIFGPEVSIIALTDGIHVVQFPAAQDYKRLLDYNKGPNTGGMGAYAPYKLSPELTRQIQREILEPAVDGMRSGNREFRGVLFAGLMLTKEGPKVLEFNARFGDPETQVLMMLLQSDLAPILQACVGGHLEKVEIRFRKGAAVCVVMAAEGYPENPKKGDEISGMDTIHDPNVTIFHAGTKIREDKSIETNGGRVLGVTAYGNNMSIARTRANAAVSRINFKGR